MIIIEKFAGLLDRALTFASFFVWYVVFFFPMGIILEYSGWTRYQVQLNLFGLAAVTSIFVDSRLMMSILFFSIAFKLWEEFEVSRITNIFVLAKLQRRSGVSAGLVYIMSVFLFFHGAFWPGLTFFILAIAEFLPYPNWEWEERHNISDELYEEVAL